MNNLAKWLDENGIVEVECVVSDITGETKGKIMPLVDYLGDHDPRLAESIFAKTLMGEYPPNVETVIDPADVDMELIVQPDTCRRVPWARKPTAQIIHDCHYLDGRPVMASPRHVLKRVLAQYADVGLKPIVAPEMEFYLVQNNTDPGDPLEPAPGRSGWQDKNRRAYSIEATREFEPLFEDIYKACEIQRLDVGTLTHEEGSGQLEINFQHGDPLDLADQVFYFKRTLREVAASHGLCATFMAKPMAGEPGSAMHINQSLLASDTQANVFAGNDNESSPALYRFIAGLQAYIPAAMALFAPNVNSYRRLLPGSVNTSAPINVEWGFDNRTVGIRVPTSEPHSKRVENRIAGADVNPYLAFAASLACGYLGLTEELAPRSPVTGSAYSHGHDLPADLGHALKMLKNCEPLVALFGEPFIETFTLMKQTELLSQRRLISAWERQHLLRRV